MASYSPTIIINTTPSIQVSMVGAITYQEFTNLVGIYVYQVNEIFLEALSTRQINQPIIYNIYNSSGTGYQGPLTPKVDPYQYRASFSLPTKNSKIILNGFSSLSLNVLNGENLTMFLYSDQAGINDILISPDSVNNYKNVPDKLGNLALYKRRNNS